MKRRGRIPLDHPELELPEVRKLWQTEGLFSEHYLKSRIQSNDWWPSDDAVHPLWQFCVDLFNRRYVPCAQNNEAFTRQELINPILAKLGFAWTDNLSLPDQDAEPDYILFADAAEKEQVIAESREKRYRVASALLEAKKVNHPLSQISKHQQRYPHQQIRDYLQEAQVLSWGILTNGNEWRLYCRDAKPSQFFCINFPLAIQSLENFKYFVSLFSPTAFVRDAAGKCRLDAIRESAIAAQTELESDLRQRVFTLVEILANGFVECSDNAIPDKPEGHGLLYENCLILLYRLLFILYAEGRLLLPVEPKSRKYFKDLSLARLVGPLKRFADFESQTRTRLYDDIFELCHLINGTDETKNKEYSVPRYNGGLFDPNRYPHLERWRICDAKLAEVLRGLMFAKPDRHNRELPLETMDYADLRVQQLGSIYEGLLEHHFVRNAAGHLELQTDKSERKATGTYYTPDYIVSYIVEHTLGPLVADIEQRPEVKQGKDNSFANAVLDLNICDPAMGSGHFLVEATTWLAEQIVYHPTTRFQAEFRRGESQEQTEIAYWRRRVVEACIYGVDLNPLAVELAKLSLWLTTIAGDQPLNFLDHHLRCGNSLIGAHLDDLGKLPERKKKGGPGAPRTAEQITFTFGPDFKMAAAAAIRQIQQIEGESSATVAKVKGKEKLWGEISKSLAPYKSVADLWTSIFFGQPLDEETYIATAQKILAGETYDNPTATARHFFHWELEFPEVSFATDGTPKPNPGFDAVIGNPPYVNAMELNKVLSEHEKPYWSVTFKSAAGAYDLFILFLEQAIKLTAEGCLSSLITPNKFLSAPYAVAFRDFLCQTAKLRRLLNVSRVRVFPDPSIYPIVTVIENTKPSEPYEILVEEPKNLTNPTETTTLKQDSQNLVKLPEKLWGFLLSEHLALVLKVQKLSGTLEQCATVRASSTATEADAYDQALVNDGSQYAARFINTGLIDRYATLWGFSPLTHKGKIFGTPHLDLSKPIVSENRKTQYRKPKLVFAKMAIRIEAFLDSTGGFASANTNFAYDSKYDLCYLTAVLNSNLMSVIYGAYFGALRMSGGYFQFQAPQLRILPIRRIAFTTATADRKRLAKKGQEFCESAVKKNDAAVVLRFAEQQLAADHSDVIHDLLAFLAERMMELNREKRDAARQFLADLKDFHGIDVHALTPKTKLDQFWRLATSDFFAHLRANTKRLTEQGIRLKESDEDKLRKRFESAQKKIVPLDTEIAFTDTLIDQIVYRLYSLTGEEIRIVEGTVI